jgi:endonuclease III
MIDETLRSSLVEFSRAIWREPRGLIPFTNDGQADRLLNDLERYPHAFVIACLMDRQVKAEKAWSVPLAIAERVGGFDFADLCVLSREEVAAVMSSPTPLHRYTTRMSAFLFDAIRAIEQEYGGVASRIWEGNLPSAEAVYRFLRFNGIGPKIASMACNILARDFKIEFSDYYSIDVSVDVHVRRVFGRLGLVHQKDSNEAIAYKARAIYPEFPGILDLAAWEIGRKWCKPLAPRCGECLVRELCPSSSWQT